VQTVLVEEPSLLDMVAETRLGRIVATSGVIVIVAGLLAITVDAAVTLLSHDYDAPHVSAFRPATDADDVDDAQG
jgi:hypothetical protein